MIEPLVRYEVGDGFATVTLDSPHNRNALSSRLVAELGDALTAAGADDEARAVILTHTGGTFCAGADLSEAATANAAASTSGNTGSDPRTTGMVQMLRQVIELPKPVLARVDGHVRAGGMGLLAACDLAVAGPASSFALTEVRLGLAPFMISLTLLPRLDPRAAERYYLTGERFDAATAQAIGLVTIAADDVDAAVAGLCAELAKGSPQGLAESKRLVTAGILEGFDRWADDLARRSAACFDSEEALEGMTSFLEKRPPRWAP
jgi:enoyl-CoA hydratase